MFVLTAIVLSVIKCSFSIKQAIKNDAKLQIDMMTLNWQIKQYKRTRTVVSINCKFRCVML